MYTGKHKNDWRSVAAVTTLAPDLPVYCYEDLGDAPLHCYRPEADLRPIIKSAVEGVRPHLRKGVALEVDVGETPARATVDPLQIQEVVASLAANALDATERGSVRVRLEARPTAYAIVVSDTGSGMSTDVREHLFEPFFTTKARGEGIGLGLLLSKYVITAHGGSIEVASEPGQGSTFTVLLPRGDAV